MISVLRAQPDRVSRASPPWHVLAQSSAEPSGQAPGAGPVTREPLPPPWPCTTSWTAGTHLNVRHVGDTGAPEVVYVHGLGGSSTNWTDLQGLLAPVAAGAAVDLPGFGFSSPADGFDYTLAAHTAVLERYLDGLGNGPVHLVGNSMGGAIVLLAAARRPDLVRTLTLVSPAVPDRRPDPRRLSDPRLPLAYLPVLGRPIRRELARAGPRDRVTRMIELCFAEPAAVPVQRIEEMVDELAEVEARGFVSEALLHSTVDIFRSWARVGDGSLWSVARRVRAPTLVVWGQQDRLITARRAVRTARLVRGRLLMLPRTGHVAQMERPGTVARAVRGMWHRVADGTW